MFVSAAFVAIWISSSFAISSGYENAVFCVSEVTALSGCSGIQGSTASSAAGQLGWLGASSGKVLPRAACYVHTLVGVNQAEELVDGWKERRQLCWCQSTGDGGWAQVVAG